MVEYFFVFFFCFGGKEFLESFVVENVNTLNVFDDTF